MTDCAITVSQNAYKALQDRVKELEQVMTLHFITTGDDHLPEGEQGERRAKEFRAECGRIIMRDIEAARR